MDRSTQLGVGGRRLREDGGEAGVGAAHLPLGSQKEAHAQLGQDPPSRAPRPWHSGSGDLALPGRHDVGPQPPGGREGQ